MATRMADGSSLTPGKGQTLSLQSLSHGGIHIYRRSIFQMVWSGGKLYVHVCVYDVCVGLLSGHSSFLAARCRWSFDAAQLVHFPGLPQSPQSRYDADTGVTNIHAALRTRCISKTPQRI